MARTTADPQAKAESLGDWRADQARGYVAHFDPELGFSGPSDAFVWFGQPWQGNPHRNSRIDEFTGKSTPCAPYLDENQIAVELGGVKVQWVEWDSATHCSVYRRVEA